MYWPLLHLLLFLLLRLQLLNLFLQLLLLRPGPGIVGVQSLLCLLRECGVLLRLRR